MREVRYQLNSSLRGLGTSGLGQRCGEYQVRCGGLACPPSVCATAPGGQLARWGVGCCDEAACCCWLAEAARKSHHVLGVGC
jgi:hypothetical protein